MKTIKYIELYKYYSEKEGLGVAETLRNINRVRQLPDEYKELVAQIIEGNAPEFEHNGVSLRELIEEEGMKPLQAVLFLDWYRRKPIPALQYMHSHRLRAQIKPLDETEKSIVEKALANLNKTSKDDAKNESSNADNSTEDILISDSIKMN